MTIANSPRAMIGDIPVFCAYDELLETEKIVGNPRNPNEHPTEQIELLAKIISHQGWRNKITISRQSGYVVKGHGRLAAAIKLGCPQVPVEYQNYATEADEWADMTADNRIAELAEMNQDKLAEILAEINESDLPTEMTGYTQDDLDDILENFFSNTDIEYEVEEDDYEVNPPEEPKAKPGDIYQMGNHRLMCGDSTNADDVYTLMDEQTCSLLITDPPYNVEYTGKTEDSLTIQNDSMDDESFRLFLASALKCADNVMKPGAVFYIWHADSEGYNFRGACRDNEWQVRQCLIWRKNTLVLGRQDYHWQHEPCLYGWKSGASHFWNSDRTQTTILDFDKPQRNGEHPTMKPVNLFSYQIQNNTRENDIVLDLFGGSGTTLIACEQLNRTCYMMELDPRYVDVILDRWEKLTGKQAVLVNGEEGAD